MACQTEPVGLLWKFKGVLKSRLCLMSTSLEPIAYPQAFISFSCLHLFLCVAFLEEPLPASLLNIGLLLFWLLWHL